jgi:hypothetical protein
MQQKTDARSHPLNVMAGLVPAIHVCKTLSARKTWMPGMKRRGFVDKAKYCIDAAL